MGKKLIYSTVMGILLTALLAGCGDGTEEMGVLNGIDVIEPIELSEEDLLGIDGWESSGELASETQGSESGQGSENGQVSAGGLSYSTGSLSAEAEAAILEAMTTLLQNLELPEYLGEGIHMVSSQEWFETMARELYEGSRNYILRGGSGALSAQIGYDVEDEPYINICYQTEEGDIMVLKHAKSVTSLLQTKTAEGKYEGSFDKWLIESKTGHILREQGTYAGGIIVGEYTKSEYTGSAGEVFDLWTNRENFEYKTTVINYDENGEVIVTPEPTVTPTNKPTQAPTQAPATQTPTQAPATQTPTQAPATQTPTQAPATQTPTQAPATQTPTQAPTQTPTQEPTQTPTQEPTQAPTQEPTQDPGGQDTDIGWSPDLDV